MSKTFRHFTGLLLPAILLLTFMSGCENGGGSSNDFGTNNPNVISAMGDSITALEGGNSTTYPAILAGMTGKTVINHGSGGATAGEGAGGVNSVLSGDKPAYLLILYGANDVIRGIDTDSTISALRAMVAAAKNNKTVPIVATITPMFYEHEVFDPSTHALNNAIRQMASEEGCQVADLERAFGNNTSLFNDDGLHPNDAGLRVIAQCFADTL